MTRKPKIIIYGNEYCSYCLAARMLLKKKGLDFDDKLITSDPAIRDEMERRSGSSSVPQIFIDDEPIGGFDELYELERNGGLDRFADREETVASN